MINSAINSNDVSRTLAEPVAGDGHLTWASPGKTLIIDTGKTYSGKTTASNTAIISIGNGGVTGSVAGEIVSNATVIFNKSANETVSNVLNGTGLFIKNTNTVLTLTGASGFSGTFQNNAGTLNLGDGTASVAMGAGNFVNAGVMNSNSSGPLTVGGVISGAGTFNKNNTNTTILANNNTYTGLTTISTGTLQVGNGGATGGISGPINNNANLVFNRTGAYTTQTPVGAGTVRVVAGQYQWIAGSDFFANSTTGTMTVEAGATFYVDANGIMEMAFSGFFINGNGNVTFNPTFRVVFNGNFTFNAVGGGTFTRSAKAGGSNFRPNVMNFVTNGGARCNWVINNAPANQAINHTFNIAVGTDGTSDFLISGNNSMTAGNVIKTGLGRLQVTNPNTSTGTTTVNAGTLLISNATGISLGATAVNSGGTLTYTVNTTGTRTVTANAGGTINRGGFAHTGTTFVNNGGTINL